MEKEEQRRLAQLIQAELMIWTGVKPADKKPNGHMSRMLRLRAGGGRRGWGGRAVGKSRQTALKRNMWNID